MITILTLSSAALAVQTTPPPSAPTPDYTFVYMYKEKKNPTNPNDPIKRHTPPVRLKCLIHPDGEIILEGIETETITEFEIWTPEGIPVASFNSKDEFIEAFYTLNGEFEIRFITEDFVIKGLIMNNY